MTTARSTRRPGTTRSRIRIAAAPVALAVTGALSTGIDSPGRNVNSLSCALPASVSARSVDAREVEPRLAGRQCHKRLVSGW